MTFQGQAEAALAQKDPSFGDYYDRATEYYQQALKINENFISSLFHLGSIYHKTKQSNEALNCFSKVIMKVEDDKIIYIARGSVYQDMGNHVKAI